MLRIFSCACSPSVYPFGEVFTQVFCPVFDLVVCFLVIELYKLFIYSGNESLVDYAILIFSFLSSSLFLWGRLECASSHGQALSFRVSQAQDVLGCHTGSVKQYGGVAGT